jgi:hypothetical protein
MATTSSPYGLIPVNRIDGMAYAGATDTFLIDPAGYNTNIFYGSVVIINASGFINISTATGADITTNNLGGANVGAIGVFVGCEFVNAQGQVIFSQYYPANTVAPTGTTIRAKVVTDPNVAFEAQLTVGTITQSVVGTNTFFAAAQSTSTGNTRSGNSTSALSPTVQTAAAAFRIIGIVSPLTDTYPDVLVKFNPSAHSYLNNVGL